MSNLPFSEQYRIIAKEWVEKKAAADLLEESKSAVLARLMAEQGDLPVSHAERNVKRSEPWQDYIKKMCEARAAESLLRVKMVYIKMRASEFQDAEATKRAEMRL